MDRDHRRHRGRRACTTCASGTRPPPGRWRTRRPRPGAGSSGWAGRCTRWTPRTTRPPGRRWPTPPSGSPPPAPRSSRPSRSSSTGSPSRPPTRACTTSGRPGRRSVWTRVRSCRPIPGQKQAGAVSEDRAVNVEGHEYEASPQPGDRTQHYYPGGMVAGRPVPQGWYSEPWWQPALVAGAWGVGSYLVASTLFAGMAGMGGWDSGYDAGYDAGHGRRRRRWRRRLGDGGDSGGDYSAATTPVATTRRRRLGRWRRLRWWRRFRWWRRLRRLLAAGRIQWRSWFPT